MGWNTRNVLCLYLILSKLGPSAALRSDVEVASQMDQGSDQRHNESMQYNFTMVEEGQTAKHACPNFLKSNATAKYCYYEGSFEHDDLSGEFHRLEVFKDYKSTRPLLFRGKNKGGGFLLQPQFISEMAAAMSSKEALEVVFSQVIAIERERNISFKEHWEHFKHEAHDFGENVKPLEFIYVHLKLHALLEGIVISMHGLEALAELGLHGGLAITEGMIEAAAWGAIAVGAHEIAAFVPIIGWALLVPMAIFDIWMARKHYKEKQEHAETFAKRLVLKSKCMENQVGVRQEMVLKAGYTEDPANFVKPIVAEVCGTETARLISKQMQRTNFEMMRFFRKLEEVGRCLFPHGDRWKAKRNCAAATYMPLREAEGAPGLVFEALMLAATYAQQSDQISAYEHYGPWFRVEFGIDVDQTKTFDKMFNDLKTKDYQYRGIGCMSLLATHRAFERLFMRTTKALPVWFKTYARDIRHTDMTLVSTLWPCTQVFLNPMKTQEADDHLATTDEMCKDEQFKEGHGDDEIEINEEKPCMAEVTIWPMVAPHHH